MRPYRLQMAHALEETDYAVRVAFARGELGRLGAGPDRLNNMLFTDEAHFHLCGGSCGRMKTPIGLMFVGCTLKR
jgi:hypothetical protein